MLVLCLSLILVVYTTLTTLNTSEDLGILSFLLAQVTPTDFDEQYPTCLASGQKFPTPKQNYPFRRLKSFVKGLETEVGTIIV